MKSCVTRRITRSVAPRAQCRWATSRPSRDLGGPKPQSETKKPGPAYASPAFKPSSIRSSRRPPPPPPPPETLRDVWRARWLPLSGAALAAGALGFYIFGTVAATLKPPPSPSCSCGGDDDDDDASLRDAVPTGRPPALTGENAEKFDRELDWSEWWVGITSLRRRLAAQASGHVLELAVGSGRNLEYYDWSPIADALTAAQDDSNDSKKTATAKSKAAAAAARATRSDQQHAGVTSYTGLDISVDMLDVTRRKLTRTVPPLQHAGAAAPVVRASPMAGAGGHLSFLDGRLRLVHSDAHHALPAPPSSSSSSSSGKYDTIVQTFGLCSVADPVAVLRNLASAVRPGSGRIVLLEHGRGVLGLVNGLLDRHAPGHFRRYGCWWNRDIEAVVEDAVRAVPGLAVVRLERPRLLQMGTLVWVELRMDEKPPVAK